MAKDDPNRDDPAGNAENADDLHPLQDEESVSGVGEKTEPDLLDSTIDSLDEALPPSAGFREIKNASGVGEKTEPNLLDSTIDSLADVFPTDSTDSQEVKSGAGIGEQTEPNLLDSTIDSVEDALSGGSEDPSTPSSADSTVDSFENAVPTKRPKIVRPGSNHDDLSATMNLEEDNLFDTIDPFGINAAEKTMDVLDLDKTTELESAVSSQKDPSTVVPDSDDIAATHDTTVKGFVEQTVDLGAGFEGPAGEVETLVLGSPLDSPDVSQTINPRELSPKDAELWDSLAATRSRHGKSTAVLPAIERSFTETKLQIRPRQVVTPKHDPKTPSDYRLIRLLGKGGMGNVFVAKQESLDRMIAVKVIKPLDKKKRSKLEKSGKLESVEADRRHQFLSEAVVTGDLDHPNIVPIYDIAVTPDESLFYAMKRVIGTPWSKVLQEKTLDENLEILLKVCDAVGFAHTRGVVHRDIKPENIMLGDFGIVMVMDWGLALAKPEFEKLESIAHTAGLGGTPAFMAPEMATGPIEKIGPASDIYLLGATLFQIITGSPPHQAENVTDCIRAVTTNKIAEAAPEHQGELLNIALKAMETEPDDRYADVIRLQDAIRDYRSHAESVTLASRARNDFLQGKENRDYKVLSRATLGFEEAIALWPGNRSAYEGLAETKIVHAEAAYDNGDFDLGLSLLDREDEAHQPTIIKLKRGMKERQQRESRLVLFKRAAAAMLAFILVGGAIALYRIDYEKKVAQKNEGIAKVQTKKALEQQRIAKEQERIAKEQERNAKEQELIAKEQERIAKEETIRANDEAARAEKARAEADASAKEALVQKANAIESKDAAEKSAAEALASEKKAKQQEQIAKTEQQNAERSAKEALAQKRKAEYEVYLSQIGLAKARIERNEFDDARRILQELMETRGTTNLGWEWRWLNRQAYQSQTADLAEAAAADLAIARSGKRGAVVLEDGSVELFSLDSAGNVIEQSNYPLPANAEASAVAYSADERFLAIGTISGEIQIWNPNMQRRLARLQGHENHVSDLTFAPSGALISGSTDRTARVWNIASGKEIAACWHIAPVQQVAVAERGSLTTLITAVADSTTGRAVVWSLSGSAAAMKAERVGEFLEHSEPVSSVAVAPDGGLVATGDAVGNILVWRPSDVQKTDYARAITSAVRQIKDDQAPTKKRRSKRTPAKRLIDDRDSAAQLVSVRPPGQSPAAEASRAHSDIIESIRFSDDGGRLLSASDDYTLKLWDVDSQTLAKTLRGHGGWVTDADFVAGSSERIISTSRDATIRSWDASTYVGDVAVLTSQTTGQDAGPRESQAHADEIWSASFDPSGKRIVSASVDHTARILQIDPKTMTFREVARLRDTAAESKQLEEGTAFLAMSVVVDRPHQRLYVGSADSTVRVWDLNLGTELGQANGTGLNTSLALSGNGRLLLTGSSSQKAKAILWEVDPKGSVSPRQRFRLRGHDQAVTAFAISSDGSLLFTGDRVGLGFLWDATTGRQVGRIEDMRGFRINAAAFSPSGAELLVAADDQQLSIIDVESRKRIDRLPHDGFVTQLSLSKNGKYALTVDELRTQDRLESKATLWNLSTKKRRVLEEVNREAKQAAGGRGERIDSAQFGLQDQFAVVSRSVDGAAGRINVYSATQSSGKPLKPLELPESIGAAQVAMPISNRQLLTLNGDAAFLWDLETMNHVKSYRSHAALTEASFSFDGRFVATGSRSVKIWDAATGLAVSKLENPHEGPVRAVQFSPVGPTYVFATAGDDGKARVWTWDPATRKFTMAREFVVTQDQDNAMEAASVALRSVSFAPDGRSILTTGTLGTVRLLRFWDRHETRFDIDQRVEFTCGVISPDGEWIAAGSDDAIARMWKIPADDNQPSGPPIVFKGHADRIEDIRILMDDGSGTPQPPRVLTAARDKSARVWDPRLPSEGEESEAVADKEKEGREVVVLRKHTQGVTAIDVTANGNLVMTAGRDGAVILWPASPQQPATEPKNVFDSL